MKLIYGSTALKHWIPSYLTETKDLDYICDDLTLKSTRETEYYWTLAFEYLRENNKDKTYVDLDLLYTIKVSHAAWDIKWSKTIKHIELMQKHGAKLNKNFYNLLIKDWEMIHGKKKVNLKKNNEEFFDNDKITRKYPHDFLHEHFATKEVPMHNLIRPDLNSPMCSEELFLKLSEADKLLTAVEEVNVIAYERRLYIKSSGRRYPLFHARLNALKQLITTMTKGWFNLYLIENTQKILYSDTTEFTKKARLLGKDQEIK